MRDIPSHAELPIYQGGEIVEKAMVDWQDFAWASTSKWRRHKSGLVCRSSKSIFLHKVIAEAAGLDVSGEVDHANGNQLDCRRDNLRPASHRENGQNIRRKAPKRGQNPSRFRGVCWHQGKWRALVNYLGKQYSLGYYDDELVAAMVAEVGRERILPFAVPDPELWRVLRSTDWSYDTRPSGHPYDWTPATRGGRVWDQLDFHCDLGCGRVKKGRIGVDLRWSPGVDLVMNLDSPILELPFQDGAISSLVSHHMIEHVTNIEAFMEECYRILKPGGVFRIIVPLFPSYSAVAEYDHKRYFMEGTFLGFCAEGDSRYTDGFAEPYNSAAFKILDEDLSPPSPPDVQWTPDDAREMRITLWKPDGEPPDPFDLVPR